MQKTFDYVIAGAGVLGLWAARHALLDGNSVCLIEKRVPGAGASGGFLGALMPHMPDRWNDKKQMQLDGLRSLPEAVAALEADTGVDCGYRRCGRLIPFHHEAMMDFRDERERGAAEFWNGEFELIHTKTDDRAIAWTGLTTPEFGFQFDSLSARIAPTQYVAALEAFVRPRATMIEGQGVTGVDPASGSFSLAGGRKVIGDRLVIANGWEAYSLVEDLFRGLKPEGPIGRGVKGQAMLVEYPHDDTLPILYHDGTYIVPHAGNRLAIGATSVNDWRERGHEPDQFDKADMAFYERATAMVPALKDAPVIARWAGVRPRNLLPGRGTEPWFAPVPDHENVIALLGGFKITFGIAHLALPMALGRR